MRQTTEIRNAIAAKLTTLGLFNKVYSYTKLNIPDADLPAAIVSISQGVYTPGDYDDMDVSIQLRIEIKDKGMNVEDILDGHAELVEPLLKRGETLNGILENLIPSSFDYSLDPTSNAGIMGLNFEIDYEKV